MVVGSDRLRDRVAPADLLRATEESAILEAIIEELYPWARSSAYLLCRNSHDAEDLVQDALVRLVRRPPDPLNSGVVRAWLRTGMFRLYLRRSQRGARELRAVRTAVAGRRATLELSSSTAELLDALAGLSARQRACVVLRYLEDLSEADVAHVLGTKVGTVKAHLAQARARLRTTMPA